MRSCDMQVSPAAQFRQAGHAKPLQNVLGLLARRGSLSRAEPGFEQKRVVASGTRSTCPPGLGLRVNRPNSAIADPDCGYGLCRLNLEGLEAALGFMLSLNAEKPDPIQTRRGIGKHDARCARASVEFGHPQMRAVTATRLGQSTVATSRSSKPLEQHGHLAKIAKQRTVGRYERASAYPNSLPNGWTSSRTIQLIWRDPVQACEAACALFKRLNGSRARAGRLQCDCPLCRAQPLRQLDAKTRWHIHGPGRHTRRRYPRL
jgi:hypothetical protein